MKTYLLLSLIFLLAPLTAVADYVKCTIIAAKEETKLAKFVGGQIAIDLTNGNSTLYHLIDGKPLELVLISDEKVSSFGAPRSSCVVGSDKLVRPDGSVSAAVFRFNQCLLSDVTETGTAGYVRANVGFDLTRNTGAYRDIFLAPRGKSPTHFVDFQDCVMESRPRSKPSLSTVP